MSDFDGDGTRRYSLFDRVEQATEGVGELALGFRDVIPGLQSEGLTGIADPRGLADRARARRELAGRFDLLPEPTGFEKDAADDAARVLGNATTEGGTDEAAVVRTLNNRPLHERARILAAYEQRNGRTLDAALHDESTGLPPGHPALTSGFAEQHNVLTKEQYERVVRLYSDIRLGRTDLLLPDGDERGPVLDDVGAILQTESGRGLIQATADDPLDHRTLIDPNVPGGDPARAHAEPTQMIFTNRGEVAATTTVRYAPGQNTDFAIEEPWGDDFRSDRILYHELVHAYHLNRGTHDGRPLTRENGTLPGDDSGPETKLTMGEYQATGLRKRSTDRFTENRYAQERRRVGATNRGERTGDDDQRHRDSYHGTVKAGAPATPFEPHAD